MDTKKQKNHGMIEFIFRFKRKQRSELTSLSSKGLRYLLKPNYFYMNWSDKNSGNNRAEFTHYMH